MAINAIMGNMGLPSKDELRLEPECVAQEYVLRMSFEQALSESTHSVIPETDIAVTAISAPADYSPPRRC